MIRVFTKHMLGAHTKTAGSASIWEVVDSWVVQEDITIIGVAVACDHATFLNNDGHAWVGAEVSQSGVAQQDGRIAEAWADVAWNSAPAFGYNKWAQSVVMFPKGYGVPIKEEGTVYLHGNTNGVEVTVADVTVSAMAIIYYVKGKANK